MAEFVLTPEQELIRSHGRATKDNMIIHALAGAAKTTTLVLLARAIQVPIRSIAFNVRIVKEMKERMPGNVETMTLNGAGHRAWAKTLGQRLVVNKDKVYEICSGLIDELKGEEKSEGYAIMTDLMKAVREGKSAGYIPKKFTHMGHGLVTEEDLMANLDEEPSLLLERLIIEASEISVRMALKGQIDFDDQILIPTCFGASFDPAPLHLLDESQDFSALNHAMLRKMIKTNRVIAVGDENQGIYGFRGAHADSMALLKQEFSMQRFDLSVCFRCPQAVIKEAHFRTPQMQWPEWAKEGSVTHLDKWSTESLPIDSVILCRNNAPLFSCAIKLLRNGRYPELVGADIGKMLIKVMKKLGHSAMPIADAKSMLNEWKEKKLAKTRDAGRIYDQVECIQVFFEQADTLGGAIAYAEKLLSMSGSVKLMTVHKAKGLEFPNIFILDQHLIRSEKNTQEKNLLYVAITRAQETLTYIETEGFEGV